MFEQPRPKLLVDLARAHREGAVRDARSYGEGAVVARGHHLAGYVAGLVEGDLASARARVVRDAVDGADARTDLIGIGLGREVDEDPPRQAAWLQRREVGGCAGDVADERALEERAVAALEPYLVVVNDEVVADGHPGHRIIRSRTSSCRPDGSCRPIP